MRLSRASKPVARWVSGARYDNGMLTMKYTSGLTVQWTDPSIGFDAGANADALFQRFLAIDGSLYFISGISYNYYQSDKIIARANATWCRVRADVNVDYMKYTRKNMESFLN